MPLAGFEPAIPEIRRTPTYAQSPEINVNSQNILKPREIKLRKTRTFKLPSRCQTKVQKEFKVKN
jgi:hypothetical protein